MNKDDQIKLWCKGRLFELMCGIGDNDAKTVLKELLDFIDSDPFAEPAPQDSELSKVERTGKDCKDQPASDDLEKEIQHYLCKEWAGDPVAAARHFAEWQKDQLMAKAVDVTIAIPYQNGYGGYTQLVDSKESLPFGENLKVLVINEG